MKKPKYGSRWWDIHKKPKPRKTDVICKKFGCDKVLTDMEYLYSEYCTKHALEMKKYNYSATLYKYDNNLGKWLEQRTIQLTIEQFMPFIEDNSIHTIDTEKTFYRYDLCMNNRPSKTIYSYSPNLFD